MIKISSLISRIMYQTIKDQFSLIIYVRQRQCVRYRNMKEVKHFLFNNIYVQTTSLPQHVAPWVAAQGDTNPSEATAPRFSKLLHWLWHSVTDRRTDRIAIAYAAVVCSAWYSTKRSSLQLGKQSKNRKTWRQRRKRHHRHQQQQQQQHYHVL